MKVKSIVSEDFTHYKKPCMLINTSKCNFKCNKETKEQICKNSELEKYPIFDINDTSIIYKYLNNPITSAICISGLEPFDNFKEVQDFILKFRALSNDDIVIYTGYNPSEIAEELKILIQPFYPKEKSNIIIKFGRFLPNDKERFDEFLGIKLASSNQFATTLEEICNQIRW